MYFFFFNDTATTEIYTLSLHDALPILDHPGSLAAAQGHPDGEGAGRGRSRALPLQRRRDAGRRPRRAARRPAHRPAAVDRKSTRLNSSHANISYAVFCLKKKKKKLRCK